jgi:sulfite oxidase
MNGQPLAADHGAPLRVIVPGYIGARSVKWLTHIRVEREPTDNHFQSAYSIHGATSGNGEVLGPLRLNSAFALADGARLAPGPHTLRGWSMAGGDATIIRVEVSTDGGSTWTGARFTTPETRYVWRLWEADVTLGGFSHELVCRAFDSSGASQPADPHDVWNAKGYMNNCWHRVATTPG